MEASRTAERTIDRMAVAAPEEVLSSVRGSRQGALWAVAEAEAAVGNDVAAAAAAALVGESIGAAVAAVAAAAAVVVSHVAAVVIVVAAVVNPGL